MSREKAIPSIHVWINTNTRPRTHAVAQTFSHTTDGLPHEAKMAEPWTREPSRRQTSRTFPLHLAILAGEGERDIYIAWGKTPAVEEPTRGKRGVRPITKRGPQKSSNIHTYIHTYTTFITTILLNHIMLYHLSGGQTRGGINGRFADGLQKRDADELETHCQAQAVQGQNRVRN